MPCPADEADWARAYAMRQLQMLGELAEIGLDVARALERQANGQGAPAVQGDVALAYSRVSRAVRLTLMLQSKLIEDLKAADKARVEIGAEAAKQAALSDPAYQKKVRVEAIVERVIRAERPDDAETLDTLMNDACERLDDEDVYGDLMERPLSELVARICKDLGLTPDWAELAEELWAVREAASAEVGWPLAAEILARPPPFTGEGDREAVERVSSVAANDLAAMRTPSEGGLGRCDSG
jgi:hypothetical protein